MKELVNRSQEFQESILRNPALLKELSERIAEILDEQRIAYKDPTPEPAGDLRRQILQNPELFAELSQAIGEVLKHHGLTLAKGETFGFLPAMKTKPIFIGEVMTPLIPLPPPKTKRWDGYHQWEQFPEIRRWFDGIPAPEVLVAIEKQRIAHN
jgi:hypothetical protein